MAIRAAFENVAPDQIERRSMQIIDEELHKLGVELDPHVLPVVKRAVHASADFDYARNLVFLPDPAAAVEAALQALRAGCDIVCDTNMALTGMSRPALGRLGCSARCFMADEDVARDAAERKVTRAVASVDKAARLYGVNDVPDSTEGECAGRPLVLVVGNAPTALARICELVDAGVLTPSLVVGVPVGFVNVVAAKELAVETCSRHSIPAIVALGRKGGSNVAAAIVNALLYEAGGRQ